MRHILAHFGVGYSTRLSKLWSLNYSLTIDCGCHRFIIWFPLNIRLEERTRRLSRCAWFIRFCVVYLRLASRVLSSIRRLLEGLGA
jgi:hypothetical protein